MQRLWKVREVDENEVQNLSNQMKISRVLSTLLINHGIKTASDAKIFLEPKLQNLRSPFLLKDIKPAVQRVCSAMKESEKIVIYGDYDVDGITSSALLFNFFNEISYPIEIFIPDRFRDGYGLNKERLKEIIENGAKLIISVDCGTTNIEEAKFLKENNVDLIVIDHHCPYGELPDVYSLINPLQPDCKFPFKELASVGLVFYFLIALKSTLIKKEFFHEIDLPDLREYLPIVSIGTIGDIAPLLYENRIFAKYGLENLPQTNNSGIQSILEITGLRGKKITSSIVSFIIAPRFNASGRLSSALAGVKLITTKSWDEAIRISAELDFENRCRQNIEIKIFEEATEIIEKENLSHKYKVLVIAKEGWHQGVIGIVASKLCEKYNKPSIVIAIEGEKGIGSCRSINGFNITMALRECEKYLLKYGGHYFAAGLTIEKKNIPLFRENLNEFANLYLDQELLKPCIFADMKISLNEISFDFVKDLSLFEPYGYKNPEPLFISEDVFVLQSAFVGNNKKHLKVQLEKNGVRFWGIKFDFEGNIPPPQSIIDILYTPKFEIFQDEIRIKIYLKDFKFKK